ncbi:MAG TPA: hypothetical protein VFO10_12355 [Oligoflexus sp.]|uniref:hypothetical protein n=1 Tax=Oligoflexus sp. TaxID=1971216 RepID=UPI002D7E575E|nr:hypothetical protein [Oligoflexus sp.]HET9238041.1 hypothetical protein [Oligoflexus sp.]
MKTAALAWLLTAAPYSWFGAEIRTRETFGQNLKTLRVTWLAKPAAGNCAITLFSLFNGDRIFSSGQGHWSEIGFEIYGGSAAQPLYDAFQTQYITYESKSDPAAKRGRQHAIQHRVDSAVPDIWDGGYHEFQVEWRPASDSSAQLIFRLDGTIIRKETGGDLGRLEEQLKVHSGAWMGFYEGKWAWGCSDDSPRSESTRVELDSFRIEQLENGNWTTRLLRSFDRNEEIDWSFERSSWGFESFAGSYCPGNAFARSGRLVLELDQQCGPGF